MCRIRCTNAQPQKKRDKKMERERLSNTIEQLSLSFIMFPVIMRITGYNDISTKGRQNHKIGAVIHYILHEY